MSGPTGRLFGGCPFGAKLISLRALSHRRGARNVGPGECVYFGRRVRNTRPPRSAANCVCATRLSWWPGSHRCSGVSIKSRHLRWRLT
eukprot:4052898-Pyramimonas_sp.AAC.1